MTWSENHIGQACSVVDGDMHLLVASTPRTALATIACDAAADPFEPGQLFGVDMDHVARLLPLVPLHRGLGFQVPQAAMAQGFHRPRHGRQRRANDLGNPLDGAALVPEIHRVLRLLRT
jgi:hypothetical protein